MNKVSTIGLESDPVELQWKPALLRIIGAASCSARVMKFSSFRSGSPTLNAFQTPGPTTITATYGSSTTRPANRPLPEWSNKCSPNPTMICLKRLGRQGEITEAREGRL